MRKLNVGRKLLLFAAGSMAVIVPNAFGHASAAQSGAAPQAANAAAKMPAFEVVSIRPNKSGSDDDRTNSTPDGFTARNVPLQLVILGAYHIGDSDLMSGARLIPGAPSWIQSDRYDIQAKMSDSDIAELRKLSSDQQAEQKRLMLQSLLADRFKLTLHRETKEASAYALVIAKNGPKMKKEPDEAATGGYHSSHTYIEDHAAPLVDLASRLAFLLGRPVLDKTGLTGKYDFTLQWMPDSGQASMPGPDSGQQGNAPPSDSSGPSIFTALQEQLGLKLESITAPVEHIVIDHVERPSEN